MTLSVPTKQQLSTDPPQNKEEAVFMFEIGEECRRRALRYFVEIEGMSYGEIVKFAHEGNTNSRITKDTLKRLAAKMKADGEPLQTKVPQNFLNAPKRPVRKRTETVENSEPEIEQVTITVDDPPTPTPPPTPSAPPAPSLTPSAPSAGTPHISEDEPITPTGKLNKSMKIIVKRERLSGELRMKAIAELAQLKEELQKTWSIAQRERTKLGASIHAKDVEIAEKQLLKDGCIGIRESLTKIVDEAEAVRKAARQALYHLHFVDLP